MPPESTSANSHHGGSSRLATIYLTADCNLNCPYCYAIQDKEIHHAAWDLPGLNAAMDQLSANGYRVSIGGGEPLTKPDQVLALIRMARERQMGISLLSNGYLLTGTLLEELREAGLNWLQISIDDAPNARHFSSILKQGAALGIQMAVGTVLMPKSVPQLPEMLSIFEDCQVTGWRLLRYTPLNRGGLSSKAPDNQTWIEMLLQVEEIVRAGQTQIQIRYEPSVVPLPWLQTTPQPLDVCGGRKGRRLFLFPNDEVYACGLPRRQGIALGNVASITEAIANLADHSAAAFDEESFNLYCREICQGGCMQMRNGRQCDPRCEMERQLVPVCCFEKLLLSEGRHASGSIVYPSDLFRQYLS